MSRFERGLSVGFTGSRHGLSPPQRETLHTFLVRWNPEEVHHGCCLGADEAFSVIVRNLGCKSEYAPWEIGHPSDLAEWTVPRPFVNELLPAKPPLERNRDIVDACDVLVACPEGPERTRSGTWSTVRYARRKKKNIFLIWPDGKFTLEHGASPALLDEVASPFGDRRAP